MMWQYSRRDLKVLLLATLLVFSGIGLMLGRDWRTASELSYSTTFVTANSVGVLAAVPENSASTLAAQLDERARELDAREATLVRTQGTDTRTLTIVSIMGAGLLGLILLNFYLDTRRRNSLV